MEMNFKTNYVNDLMKEKNSDVMMTFGTKFSIMDAQIINNVKSWSKF